MLSQSIALPLALAASLASSAAAFKAPVLHDHHLSTRHNSHHDKVARGWAAGAERRQQGRMQRKVRRGEGEFGSGSRLQIRADAVVHVAYLSMPGSSAHSRGADSWSVVAGAMLLTVADNSTEASTSKSSGQTYTSTAIWWLQDGWAGACGTDIKCVAFKIWSGAKKCPISDPL